MALCLGKHLKFACGYQCRRTVACESLSSEGGRVTKITWKVATAAVGECSS